MLRPGGLYLFDTNNRTRRSRLIAIRMMQEWRVTRIIDTSIHEWSMFITPDELAATLERHGLRLGEVTGLAPRARPTAIVRALRAARRGRIGYGELSRRLDFGRVDSLALSYMGFAVRR